MKPMTGDEQKAALGNVRRIPRDVDMFTGEVVTKPSKRGNGSHVKLKPVGIEKPVVPGMASYAGEGPQGKRCEDCRWFGRVTVRRPDGDSTHEEADEACVRAAQLLGRVPAMRTHIKLCAACKFFTAAKPKPRVYHIHKDGATIDGNGRAVGRPQF